MRVALLLGAHPKRCTTGPVVTLPKGTYRLLTDNLQTSKLTLWVNGSSSDVTQNSEFTLSDSERVRVEFTERGSENYVTVIAERIK